MKKFNEASRECPSCKKMYPVEYMDEDGHRITYPQNSLGLCPKCFKTLMQLIKNKQLNK